MQRRLILPLVVLISTLALSGCGGREERDIPRVTNDSFSSAESRKCLADLKAQSVRFQVLPNQWRGGGCRTIDTIKVLDLGTETANLGPMTCPLASNFAAWARHAVRPAARQYLGSDVVRIETFGTYSCRNVNGGRSGKLSEHAYANAVDVSAFILRDGRRISLLNNWNGQPQERAFLRRLHQSACKRFGTVLGPEYNAQHANHFHFDMAKSMKDGSAFCR
ncbi:extensin family protein [Sphingorhabdus contaminans]|uniref:extensin-like domain-containing protein n=1 Tax=Sphingorhabdus contaminans TaxID=1343899 RepID=UPI003D2A5A50